MGVMGSSRPFPGKKERIIVLGRTALTLLLKSKLAVYRRKNKTDVHRRVDLNVLI